MYISKIAIKDIRSYALAEFNLGPAINLIAGENNSGKSTLLRCVMIVQKNMLGATAIRFNAPEGTVQIRLEDLEVTRFHKEHQQAIATHDLKSVLITQKFATFGDHDRPQIVYPIGTFPFYGFDNWQPKNCIETFFSSRSSGDFSEVINASISKSVGGDRASLIAKIDTCITSNQLRPRFLDACNTVVGFPISTWPTDNGKMAGLEIDSVTGQVIPLSDLGSGVSQAVGLIATLLVATRKIFLIEEIENDLHPKALRLLLSLIETSALERANQFIISTHSNTVIRFLGGIATTKTFQVERQDGPIPSAHVCEVPSTSGARQRLLNALGYELTDLELWSAWLLLEESSAEALIAEFLVPLFTPKLVGRLRIVSAAGASEIAPRFVELHRLFVFVHLEPVYRNRAWVVADGDEAGLDAVKKLRQSFSSWPTSHFLNLSQPCFEQYYPRQFATEIRDALAITDKQERRDAKKNLLLRVLNWLREDQGRAAKALEDSAAELVTLLRQIEDSLVS